MKLNRVSPQPKLDIQGKNESRKKCFKKNTPPITGEKTPLLREYFSFDADKFKDRGVQ
jgi:hypothetical protein